MKYIKNIAIISISILLAWGGSGFGGESKIISYTPGQFLSKQTMKPSKMEIQIEFEEDFCDTVIDVPPTECRALRDLYEATDGENRQFHWKRMVDTQVCSWERITCNRDADTNQQRHVIFLEPANNNLSGNIPASIANLGRLQRLYFSQNNLHGTIPSSLGTMQNLRLLQLGDNQFTGPIPSSLGNLHQLLELQLQNNNLEGGIPNTLGNLSLLNRLFINGNNLSGPIPQSFANLQNLEVFHAEDNQLNKQIPNIFQDLTKLYYINLENNNLCGRLPESLMNIPTNVSTINTMVMMHNNNLITVGYGPSFTTWLNLYLYDGRGAQNSSNCKGILDTVPGTSLPYFPFGKTK